MNIDIYAFSFRGALLCDRLAEVLREHSIRAFAPERYAECSKHVRSREKDLHKSTEESFRESDALIFVGAVGIAVRAIAPFVKSKEHDPAVICIDERGQNVIPVLSGHIGGANRLAVKIGEIIGGRAVITTATDINGKLAVDEWAAMNNMHIMSMKKARDMAADILADEKIGFYSDFQIAGEMPAELSQDIKRTGICVSLGENKTPFDSTLNLIPRIVSLGVGCRKGVGFEQVYGAVREVLKAKGISHFAVKSIGSIDLKKNEEGIIRTARALKVPFYTYTKEELNNIDNTEGQFSRSDFVKSISGVDSVCERAAVMGSSSGTLIIKKTVVNSVTVAAAADGFQADFTLLGKLPTT